MPPRAMRAVILNLSLMRRPINGSGPPAPLEIAAPARSIMTCSPRGARPERAETRALAESARQIPRCQRARRPRGLTCLAGVSLGVIFGKLPRFWYRGRFSLVVSERAIDVAFARHEPQNENLLPHASARRTRRLRFGNGHPPLGR